MSDLLCASEGGARATGHSASLLILESKFSLKQCSCESVQLVSENEDEAHGKTLMR